MTRHDESLMWPYASGELEVGEAKLLELHLEECPECRERLRAVEWARETLADARSAAPAMSWATVDGAIGRLVERRLSRSSRRRWVAGGVVALAAAASAVVFLTLPVEPVSSTPTQTAVLAPVDPPPPIAQVERAEGLMLVTDAPAVLANGARLQSGDVLRTALSGSAFVHLPDHSHLRVGSATQVSLTRAERDDVALTLETGRVAVRASHAQGRRAFVVHSGGVSVRVIGTVFAVASGKGGVEVAVSEGRVLVDGERGPGQLVEAGQRVRFEPRGGRPQRLEMSASVKQELAEVRAVADAVVAVEEAATALGAGGEAVPHASTVGSARGGSLPRLGRAEARARQGSLPREVLAAGNQTTVEIEPPHGAERQLLEPGTAFPSVAGGISPGLPAAWQEPSRPAQGAERGDERASSPQPALPAPGAVDVPPPGGPAPIQGGPLTMVVPTLPPSNSGSAGPGSGSGAAPEWALPSEPTPAQAPAEWTEPAGRPGGEPEGGDPRGTPPAPPLVGHDVESIFLQRAEQAVTRGGCDRYLLGLEEIAIDTEKTERTERARVLRARCFDVSLRPRQTMSEYRKYLAEYPVGRFTGEARQALGQ